MLFRSPLFRHVGRSVSLLALLGLILASLPGDRIVFADEASPTETETEAVETEASSEKSSKDETPAEETSNEETQSESDAEAKPAAKKESKTLARSVAVFELNAAITDQPSAGDSLFGSVGGESLRTFLTRLEKAADDKTVAAIVLVFNATEVDTAQIEEIRKSILKVKEKKPVYAHADSLTTGAYLLLSGATRLSMSPTGDAWVNGLYGEQLFVRGLLDLLGVQPEFLTCGDYKSAAETYTRTEASKEASEMQNWLFDSIYQSVQEMIAENRKVEPEQAQAWLDQGLFSAESARQAGMIDAVETREDLMAYLKESHGKGIRLNKKYGKQTGPNVDLNNPFSAMQLWAEILSGPKTTRSKKDALAVVHIDGQIMLGRPGGSMLGVVEGCYSETVRKALDKVADDSTVKAVVLRVNSPGGSATASEIMLQAVRNVQKSKPVIVSMGGVAGSGGYYVACRGDRIFADSTTITGSIGVVAGKLATESMWQKAGINFDAVQRGKRAGMLRSSSPFTEEEKAELQKWMDEIYGVFKQHVIEGREGKLSKPIDEIAGGRVYTGRQAIELGLVDEIGTLDDAIRHAADKVELKDYEVRSYPETVGFLDQLLADLGNQNKNDPRLSVGMLSALAPVLQGLDPVRMEMVQGALLQLDCLREEKVMLTMPVLRILDR